MPRKMRPGKSRRVRGWSLETLHPLFDILTLDSGHIRHESSNPRVRIRSLEDARQAWEENRELFMTMCSCHRDHPRCRQHDTAFQPGHRAWAFWKFDKGYPGIPADEVGELERLGLITAAERKAMATKPKTAEIRTFNS